MKKVLIALFLAIALLFSTFYISLSLIDFSKIYHELVAGTALASAKIKDDVFSFGKIANTKLVFTIAPGTLIVFRYFISSYCCALIINKIKQKIKKSVFFII